MLFGVGIPFVHRGRMWAVHAIVGLSAQDAPCYTVSDVLTGRHVPKPGHYHALQLLDRHLRAMNHEIELTTVGANVECLAVGSHDGIGLVFPSAVLTVPRPRVEHPPCRIGKRVDMNHDDSAALMRERLG
ncbi:hypothetical protein [Burkholderia stagnalis]|uniref:hypothetical protein n=1 Tax=Burkholderia stagnalis TaxID=1503054 RepID=UPI000F80767B|nr:hypothetical protein [Burkholderia stagnalis]